MNDQQQFRHLAELYAQAADSNRPELLDSIMTSDAVVEGAAFKMAGIAEIRGIPSMLKAYYRRTRHEIHNQTVTINGDMASGETYSTASHLLMDEAQVLVWHVRYQDSFRREDNQWFFSGRKLEIDWTETRPVTLS